MRLAGVLNRRSEADDAAAGFAGGGAKVISLCKRVNKGDTNVNNFYEKDNKKLKFF